MNRKVSVERCVEQVRDGSHYKGYVKIAETKFDYELRFAIPIPQLGNFEPTGHEEVRRTFQLTLRRGEANIELTKEEYSFFFGMLVEFAIKFYDDPQTRDSNEGFMGILLQKGRLGVSGIPASASISVTSSVSCDFPPEACEMLSAPKFGCALNA